MRRSTAFTIVFFIGIACGLIFYLGAYWLMEEEFIPGKAGAGRRVPETMMYRHNGIVVSHDMQGKTVTIREPGRFDTATTTMTLRFTYDDATRWSSIRYLFDGGVNEKREIATGEAARQLPEGALVTLFREATEYEASPWRIEHIAFLRRDDI